MLKISHHIRSNSGEKIYRTRSWNLNEIQEILRLMRDGWELGWADGIRSEGRYWLQKGGCGKGGDTKDVHASTARKMQRLELIEEGKNTFG